MEILNTPLPNCLNIADFHCDLLSYLGRDKSRSAYDPASRASISDFQKGGVILQTLPIYTETSPLSVNDGEMQFEIFLQLSKKYPTVFGKKIKIVLAIENSSSVCGETEPLETGLRRLEKWHHEVGTIAYMSLTWNSSNRFGGGSHSKERLKEDGVTLLHWLDGKKIAIDLSHASDGLAEDVLNVIDRDGLMITPVASHSNFRAVVNHNRNLPDSIACEIGKKGGIIGLNLFKLFLGNCGIEGLIKQVEQADKLGLLNHLCFGTDFFEDDISSEISHLKPFFYENFDSAACYPRLVQLLSTYLLKDQIEKIAYQTLSNFLCLSNTS